ncbi:hypothetical protein ACPZ19_26720 [Amycolatopsis lurida]
MSSQDDKGRAMSWERWPQGLSSQADEVVAELRAGRPGVALDVLDALINDLTARRETLADLANRRFEPSTDDRHT